MPLIKLLDTYVERSIAFLETNPEVLVSITYHTKPSKTSSTHEAHSYITFKTYNAQSGICYKYKTSKAKDLSRVLAALGPRGVQFTKTKKVVKDDKKHLEEKYVVNGRGFASLMSNKEFVEEQVKPEESKPEAVPEGKKKKKSKKKGKK